MPASDLVRVVHSVLCDRLSAEQANELAAAMIPFRAAPGTLVCRQGQKAVGLMLLVDGTAEVFEETPSGAHRTIATVSEHAGTRLAEAFERLAQDLSSDWRREDPGRAGAPDAP